MPGQATTAIRDDDTTYAATTSRVAGIYTRDTTDARALVVDGHGASITVHRGHLVLADGVGPYRRERKLSRVERTVRRIIVLAHSGHVTLEAIRWCADVGITLVHVQRDGTILGSVGATAPDDAKLRRAQALTCTPVHPAAVAIAAMLLRAKIAGQADNVACAFNNTRAAERIRGRHDRLNSAASVDTCRSIEGGAAADYWQSWVGSACPNWRPADLPNLPAHWCMFTARPALTNEHKSNRGATDPINAALNYGYALAESECRTELLAHGLDPAFGVLHVDKPSRASLALDLLEVLRPTVDRTVIEILGVDHRPDQRHLDTKWFRETREGMVRLCAPLTHEIAECIPAWGDVVRPYVRRMVDVFTASSHGANGAADYAAITGAVPRARRAPVVTSRDRVRVSGGSSRVVSTVSDELWEQLAAILPATKTGNGGRPRVDNRTILTGLLLGMNGHPIPDHLGVHRATVNRRLQEWKTVGVWDAVRELLVSRQVIGA